jgi:hypothetical protein
MTACGSACFALFKSFSVLAHQETHRSKRGGGGGGGRGGGGGGGRVVRGCGGKGVSVGGEGKSEDFPTTRQVARLEEMEVEEEVEKEEEEGEDETVVAESFGASVVGFAACLALVCFSL